jgi:hypothetical protein
VSKCDHTALDVFTIDATFTYQRNAWISVRVRQISTLRLSTPVAGEEGVIRSRCPRSSPMAAIESIPTNRWAQPWLGAFFSRQVLARYASRPIASRFRAAREGIDMEQHQTMHVIPILHFLALLCRQVNERG